jgi:hypothetical protein
MGLSGEEEKEEAGKKKTVKLKFTTVRREHTPNLLNEQSKLSTPSAQSLFVLFSCIVFTYMVRPSCFSFSLKGRTRMTTRTLSSPGDDEAGGFAMDDVKEDDDEALAGGIAKNEVGGWRLAKAKIAPLCDCDG